MNEIRAFVLNYNGGDKIIRCLEHVLNEVDKVTLVDNHSTDGSWIEAKDKFPQINLYQNEVNEVARAFNYPVQHSDCDWAFLVIGDMMMQKGCLASLLPHINDDVFSITPKIVRNGKTEWGATKVYWKFFQPKIFWDTSKETATVQDFPPFVGLFNRWKFSEINGVSDSYAPTYYDDVDIGFRARKKGWKCIYEPKGVVVHEHEAKIRSTFKNLRWTAFRNKQIFAYRARWGL